MRENLVEQGKGLLELGNLLFGKLVCHVFVFRFLMKILETKVDGGFNATTTSQCTSPGEPNYCSEP
jgi:hypothetical protein